MTVKPRCPIGGRPGPRRPAGDLATAKKPAGRPQGEPSTIVNVRLPLTLVAELDRYLDRLEGQTGLGPTAGMITRCALALFLASHAAEAPRSGKVEGGIVADNRDCRAEQEEVWTIVAHKQRARGGRAGPKGGLQKRESHYL